MKIFGVSVLLFISFVLFGSCKNEAKDAVQNSTLNDSIQKIDSIKFKYVLAPNGLSLRDSNSLQGKKLTVMPFGAKVNVLNVAPKNDMAVGGIAGGMDEIEFSGSKGFAFNGYLTIFPLPEPNVSARDYAATLKIDFPEVIFEESTGGMASRPTKTQSLSLPGTAWHEAFFIAQRLFDIPAAFDFPLPSGSASETVKDPNQKRNVWQSELQVSRKNNSLDSIQYHYRSEGFGSQVLISKEDGATKISKTEIAD